MTGAISTYIRFWPLFWFTSRYPLARGVVGKHLVLPLLALPVWSFLQTSIMAISRPPLYQCALGQRYDYGHMPVRHLMEFSIGAFVFWAEVMAIAAFRFPRELRLREVRTAQLERELTQAHLDALRLQLRPRFLFNALNAVSSVMYEDPRKADRMISSLSDFLRAVPGQESTETVALKEEHRLLNHYLAIMQVRFGDRLRVTVEIPEALCEVPVPPLPLQPLVENCVRHGVHPESGRLDVEIRAEQVGELLRLTVRDHGPGVGEDPTRGSGGVGLSDTRRRLERMYGSGQRFSLENAPGGGVVATVEIPIQGQEELLQEPGEMTDRAGRNPETGERRGEFR